MMPWRQRVVALAVFLNASVAAAQVHVGLGEMNAAPDSSILIPLKADNLTGKEITSFEFVVSCDTSVMQLTGIDQAGTLSFGLMMFANNRVKPFHSGLMKVVCASAQPLAGDGVLVYLTAKARHKAGVSPVQLSSFLLNRGTPQVISKNGVVRVTRPTAKK